MDLLFLCGVYPPNVKNEIFSNSRKGYQFAAQNFQEALIDGFAKNNESITVISKPFLSSFPVGYKKLVFYTNLFKIDSLLEYKPIFFINAPFFRNLISNTRKEVFKWCEELSDRIVINILVYSLNADLMKVAVEAKKRFKNVKLSLIVLDLPEFMGSNKIHRLLGLKERETRFIYGNIHFFDKFVLLTEAMKERLALNNDTYCVVEGIYKTDNIIDEQAVDKEEDVKTILYTGALVRKYGLDTLLTAFHSIKDEKIRLVICGDGEAKQLIEEFCLIDNRILFKGKVHHGEILKYQKEASLLINPRPIEGEYTKYSFPSKTMEYFASGTPVLMYRLPGVPQKYFDYCFTLEGSSIDEMASKIINILKIPNKDRRKLGLMASEFVLKEKNSKRQVEEIIKLLKS